MNIRFTDEMNPRRAAKVVDVLRSPRLYIPTEHDYGIRHDQWLPKVEQGLIDGDRHAVLADEARQAVGTVVFRQDVAEPHIIDVRNISIDPSVRGRHFGSFAVRNAEYSAGLRYPDATQLRVDTKATNQEMLAFLASLGYTQESVQDLYDSGMLDIVLTKPLR